MILAVREWLRLLSRACNRRLRALKSEPTPRPPVLPGWRAAELAEGITRLSRILNHRELCCGAKKGQHDIDCETGNPAQLHPYRGCSCGGERTTGYEHDIECVGYWPPAAAAHRRAVDAQHGGEWHVQPPPSFYELPMHEREAVSWVYGQLALSRPELEPWLLWATVLAANRVVREHREMIAEHAAVTPLCPCSPETRATVGCVCGALAKRDEMAARRRNEQ